MRLSQDRFRLAGMPLAAALALALAGCAGGPEPLVSSAAVTVIDATELPPPTEGAGAGTYKLGNFDRVTVDVLGFAELSNRRLQVDGGGNISLALAGEVHVVGLTPGEAADLIEQRLRAAHVRNPQVAVNLEESLSKFVTVDGEVAQPGNYPLVGEMTLMRAVASARGVSEFARMEDVVVFRTVNGQRMAALYNLAAIRRGQYADPSIYAQDIVIVGNSPARRMFRDFISVTPLIAGPLVAILNNI